MTTDPCPTISELAAAYRAGTTSPVEATEACLARIAALDGELHAFITVTAELARAQARIAADELVRGHDRGPLHGVPVALKDLIDVAGVRTTAGSDVDRVATVDAEVVTRLRAAGAVILGKTNLHEHAYGASGAVGYFPATRNPRNPAHIAGGSSSGSAAAVAAGMCPAAIGSDTSGSIRIPAALCGVVGLKPSYGLVSVRGVLPLAWSYDHLGPIARTVDDAALLLRAIADVPDAPPAARVRVGVPRRHFFDELDPEIAAAVERAIAGGARDIDLPVDDDRTVFRAEAHAVHRRAIERAPGSYQAETLRRIRTGEDVLAADYIEKLHDLERLRRDAAAWFDGVDVVVTPTVPRPAPSFAELAADPASLRARELTLMRNTRPFNILGAPAISIPCGTTAAGLPVGLQLAAAPGGDGLLLRVAAELERRLR